MNIFLAARKYLLPGLERNALVAIRQSVRGFSNPHDLAAWNTDKGIQVLHLLMSRKDDNQEFEKAALHMTDMRLPDLFEDADFRRMLESEHLKGVLEQCKKALQRRETEDLELNICNGCEFMWSADTLTCCPDCGANNKVTHTARCAWIDK